MDVGVIGAGSWGTTLAVHLAANSNNVRLWAHQPEERAQMQRERHNVRYLPGITFPESISIPSELSKAIEPAILLIVTPTQFIRSTLSGYGAGELDDKLIINASKGIETSSLLRISELFQSLWAVDGKSFVALSGPSHAEEVSRHIPTTLVAASDSVFASQQTQDLFSTETLRVYTNEDLVGVELGGALKNVIALCAGIIDGLGYGDNTKAALITRGLAEITRLGVTLGAHPQTFSGLSGLGDLVVTCTSRHSRNRSVGEQIGRGYSLKEATASTQMVAEGVATTESAYQLSQKHGVEMPIIEQVYKILFEGKDPRRATQELMTRQTKHEIWM